MATFKGFHATTDKGTPCWVLNESVNAAGQAVYKVRLGSRGGFEGWSGGSRRAVAYNGKTGWILKAKIKRGKAR